MSTLHERLRLAVENALPGSLIPVESLRALLTDAAAGADTAIGLSLAEVGARFVTGQRRATSPAVVRRWIRTGKRGRGGKVVRLGATPFGRTYRVQEADIARFVAELRGEGAQESPPISEAADPADEIDAAFTRYAKTGARR